MSRELHILDSERDTYIDKTLSEKRDFLKDHVKVEDSPELNKVVKGFNFELLRDIFVDVFRELGLNEPDEGLVDIKKIYKSTDPSADGMYNQTFKAITLNYNSFLDRAREARFVKGLDVRVDLLVLRTYIHELIHAASKQIDVVSLDNVPADSKEVSMCGFAILSYSGEGESETEESFFVDFDEAVTEKLANEVFLEYCKRTQDFSDDELANFDKIDSIHTDSRIKMLEEMIEQVSVESGATKDDVWQKVKQGKLAGVKTVLDWIKELEQIFGENYLELLAKDSNEMRQHVENLKDKRRKAEFEKED